MAKDPDKTRQELHFYPEVMEALKNVAEADCRKPKALMERIIIEYLQQRTGKEFLTKKHKAK